MYRRDARVSELHMRYRIIYSKLRLQAESARIFRRRRSRHRPGLDFGNPACCQAGWLEIGIRNLIKTLGCTNAMLASQSFI